MLKFIFLIAFVISNEIVSSQSKVISKTILVILAHPDDETAIGPVMARLTKENKVFLVIATDGRYWSREHAGNIKGDSVVTKRRKELQCSCNALGVDSLIQLNYHDEMGGRSSVGEYFAQTKKLREELKLILKKLVQT